MKNRETEQHASGGFTLIEVLLVVAILGILAAVVVANFSGHGEKARIRATRASIKNISTAIEVYDVDTGRYPAGLDNLLKSSGEPAWSGPYLRGGVPQDAWGTPFQYARKGDRDFEVRSAGPDLSMGNDDDITN